MQHKKTDRLICATHMIDGYYIAAVDFSGAKAPLYRTLYFKCE